MWGSNHLRGQAAVELEQLAGTATAEPYPWRFGDTTGLVSVCHASAARDARSRLPRASTRPSPPLQRLVARRWWAWDGRTLRRQLPEHATPRIDTAPARDARVPRFSPSRSAERRRRVTARLQSRQGGLPHVPRNPGADCRNRRCRRRSCQAEISESAAPVRSRLPRGRGRRLGARTSASLGPDRRAAGPQETLECSSRWARPMTGGREFGRAQSDDARRRALHHVRRHGRDCEGGRRRGRHRDRRRRRPARGRDRARRAGGVGELLLCHAGIALEKWRRV